MSLHQYKGLFFLHNFCFGYARKCLVTETNIQHLKKNINKSFALPFDSISQLCPNFLFSSTITAILKAK